MQFQSDLLQIALTKPSIAETTSLGAAFVAGLGGGMWNSLQDIHELWHAEKHWQPHMPRQLRAKLLYQWKKALSRSLFWKDSATFTRNGDVVLGEETDPYLDHLPAQAGATIRQVVDTPSKSSAVRSTTSHARYCSLPKSASSSMTATSSATTATTDQHVPNSGTIPQSDFGTISKSMGLIGVAAGIGFVAGMLYQAGYLNK
jgi:hypothetical protein